MRGRGGGRTVPHLKSEMWGTHGRWLGGDGDALDFYEGVFGEAGDLDGGAGGRGDAFGGEVFGVEGVHGGEVGHVLEEDGGFDDVGEVQAGGGEDGLEVLEDAGGLGFDAAGDEARRWLGRGLPGRRCRGRCRCGRPGSRGRWRLARLWWQWRTWWDG